MIYLDYAANTPVDEQVFDTFVTVTREYPGNPNSRHRAGFAAKERMDEITEQIARILSVNANEIIYTSGASESNNLAVKGIARMYRNQGKHIISTYLEHSSVSGALTALQNEGYEIDLVDIKEDGTVDLEHLSELLRPDTILVSVCYVDSELGVCQPVEEIKNLVKEKSNAFFHTDATQAVGKIPVNFGLADLVSFTPHKFFGLNGCGVLIRKEEVILEPLIHGGVSTTMFRSGTPCIGQAASILKALEMAVMKQAERYETVKKVNQKIRLLEKQYPRLRINSPEHAVPHILNMSVSGVKAGLMQKAMDEQGICISTKSACSVPNTPSRPVLAVTHDKKNAMSSFRLSFSHLTTMGEIEEFIRCFDICYKNLENK